MYASLHSPTPNPYVSPYTSPNITQLHAPYEREPNDSYICHRTAQAWEIAKLMRGAAERNHLVLALGDFNMVPQSLAHKLITTHSPVVDVWLALHPDSSLGAAVDAAERRRGRPIPTAEFNLISNGATCDSVLNTWRWNPEVQKRLGPGKPPITVPGDTEDPKAKRLDYIFASSGKGPASRGAWVVKSARVGMTERHPTLQCSLSDHFSVEATLKWHAASVAGREKSESLDSSDGAFAKSPTVSEFQQSGGAYDQQLLRGITPEQFLPVQTYDEILAMIDKYTLRERRQRRLRLSHFVGSCVVSIGCWIAVWWSPRNFVAFLLMLLASLGFGAGIIDGLIGGLFVGHELRALKEFEWEIRNARKIAGGDDGGLVDEGVKDW